jgi:hypothetical protein
MSPINPWHWRTCFRCGERFLRRHDPDRLFVLRSRTCLECLIHLGLADWRWLRALDPKPDPGAIKTP